jgi:hypothetical protein
VRNGLFQDRRGVSTPQVALIAGGLAIASLIGVRVLEAPLAPKRQAARASESATDLERLARTIPAATARTARSALPPSGQIDFTATANNSGKRALQSACHRGERTVTMVAPAGGPPTLLTTCAPGKSSAD